MRLNQNAEPTLNFAIEYGGTLAGGVGLIACQWLKALGATVIGTVGSDEKAALAKAHGCDYPGFRHEATLNGALVDRSGTIHDELIYVLFRGTELQNG